MGQRAHEHQQSEWIRGVCLGPDSLGCKHLQCLFQGHEHGVTSRGSFMFSGGQLLLCLVELRTPSLDLLPTVWFRNTWSWTSG